MADGRLSGEEADAVVADECELIMINPTRPYHSQVEATSPGYLKKTAALKHLENSAKKMRDRLSSRTPEGRMRFSGKSPLKDDESLAKSAVSRRSTVYDNPNRLSLVK